MTIIEGQLQEVIDSGNFDALIGEVENAEFDCKAEPYLPTTEHGKRELAKDVSAFANAGGGFIFLGVKTKQSSDHFGDEVEEIRPFPQSLVNTSQYDDILRAWIFPEVFGLEVTWVPTTRDPSRGIVVIKIPKQEADIKPFLITKTIDDNKLVETIFGYVQRKGDKNPPLEVKDLQRLLRAGMHYQAKIDEQLASIQSQLKNMIENSPRAEPNQTARNQNSTAKMLVSMKQLETRIFNSIEHGNLKDGQLLVLSALPPGQHELKTIFVSDTGSIKRTLENPPILRQSGWSMETLDQAIIHKGEFIRVGNGARKVIDLYRDGTMIFATKADSSFLAWGRGNSLKIDPLAFLMSYTLL